MTSIIDLLTLTTIYVLNDSNFESQEHKKEFIKQTEKEYYALPVNSRVLVQAEYLITGYRLFMGL